MALPAPWRGRRSTPRCAGRPAAQFHPKRSSLWGNEGFGDVSGLVNRTFLTFRGILTRRPRLAAGWNEKTSSEARFRAKRQASRSRLRRGLRGRYRQYRPATLPGFGQVARPGDLPVCVPSANRPVLQHFARFDAWQCGEAKCNLMDYSRSALRPQYYPKPRLKSQTSFVL